MYYYDEPNIKVYAYYNGSKWSCSNKRPKIYHRTKPKELKNIKILVDHNTGSSAEYLTAIIKDAYPKTEILGKKTIGGMSITMSKVMMYNNQKYQIQMTFALYIMVGKKKYKYIIPTIKIN